MKKPIPGLKSCNASFNLHGIECYGSWECICKSSHHSLIVFDDLFIVLDSIEMVAPGVETMSAHTDMLILCEDGIRVVMVQSTNWIDL